MASFLTDTSLYGPNVEDENQAFNNVNNLLNALEMVRELKDNYVEAPYWINARGDAQDQAFLTPDVFIKIVNECFNNMSLIEFLTSTELDDECFYNFEELMIKEYNYIDYNALHDAETQALHLYDLYAE